MRTVAILAILGLAVAACDTAADDDAPQETQGLACMTVVPAPVVGDAVCTVVQPGTTTELVYSSLGISVTDPSIVMTTETSTVPAQWMFPTYRSGDDCGAIVAEPVSATPPQIAIIAGEVLLYDGWDAPAVIAVLHVC